MARYPPGGALPPLQWGGDPTSRPSSRHLITTPHGRRSDMDEPGGMLTRSFKDEILNGSGAMKSWQEKQMKEMLEEHIHSVTLAIKKLSTEIEAIETQLHSSERTSQYASNSVKSLEMQQFGSVIDLRSRVGRCDASIAKLSSDIRQLTESVSYMNQQLVESNSAFTKATSNLQSKIAKLESQVQSQVHIQQTNQVSVKEETQQVMTRLNNQTHQQILELQTSVSNMQITKESDQRRLQEYLKREIDGTENRLSQKQGAVEKNLNAKIDSLETRLSQMQTSFNDQIDLITKSHRDLPDRMETKMREKLSASEKTLRKDIGDVKKRSDHALASLQESLETMRAVLEGKRKLLEDDLRREIVKNKKLQVVLT